MKKYKYKMRHNWITNASIGQMKCCFNQEVTPNDTWSGSSLGIIRLDPLDYPTFMSLKVNVDLFFVPHIQTWPEFEDELTGVSAETWPTASLNSTNFNLLKALGCYGDIVSGDPVNALPLYAFNHIYNNYYRHEDIAERALTDVSAARVYFPQNEYYGSIRSEIQQGTVETIDTSGATLPVTEIRDAENRQRLKERRARYGEKYYDVLRSDYGVFSDNLELDRPEHVAHGSATIGISEVVATASSTGEETGEYRGHGITGIKLNMGRYNFKQHGILMGIISVRPRMQLKSKIERQFYAMDKEDLYLPHLNNDTDDLVYGREVYGNIASDTNFGYLPKYEWLRKARDVIALPSTVETATSHVELTSLPTVAYLQQVQDYGYLFQDNATTEQLMCFFDHKIGKESIIKPSPKR